VPLTTEERKFLEDNPTTILGRKVLNMPKRVCMFKDLWDKSDGRMEALSMDLFNNSWQS